ncbi:hypothetical protein niasHT_038993 [Heterodera trifolii]|uniref:Integrase catalytic domain-containing protein n=1 Tax=Heterodera trifolii TaxID=157864 RepID=A0ABD2IBG7_9BILA
MASKFVLVPDEIYRGLTNSDSGNINLDFVQRALERTKRKGENVTSKNVHYNQELSRYLHMRDEHQNKPSKVEITKGLKALINRGNESDEEEQLINLESDRPQQPASQIRRPRRHHDHNNGDEEMPLLPTSPALQAENRGQKRKANDFYSSWEEGAKRQLRHEDETVPSSPKIANRQRRRQPPVSLRSQIPAEIQQEEPFQPSPQPSIPIHAQVNRKRKAQHSLNDNREVKKSLIDLEELRPPSLKHEASLRFQQKRTNKPRVTQPPHLSSSALVTRRNPPRDLLAEAASAPLPDDDDAEDFGLPQQPATSAQVQPLPPGPPLPSKTKKRKSNNAEKNSERKRTKIGSRKRDLLAEAATAPLPDDDDLQLSQQPGTSAQVHPPGPPLPSKTKKRKSNKAEEDTERKRTRIGSRKRLSSPTVTKNEPKRQNNSGNERLSEEQRRQFADDQRLFTIPNSQLTNEQKRRRLQFVFNRNPAKYGVRGDTILNNAGNPITDSSVTQALEYIIERRAGRVPQFRQPPGTKIIRDRINRDLILRTWTAPPVPPTGRFDASVSNERSQAENNGPTRSSNGNTLENATSETTEMEKQLKIQKVLDRLYNDPNSPAAFAGVDRLWLEAKKELAHEISKKDVKHYLEGHRTYTLMRPRRINFPRSRTTAAGFMTDCQVDLADFQALSRHNSGNRYLMVLIEVLSKRIFVTPLRTKKADDMVEGFKQLFSQMPMKPHRIFSDIGTEFKNQQLKKLFDEEEVEKYESNHSEKKAALAERAIRQIKNRVYRYFAQLKTLNWVDVIDKIVNGINKSPSRVHGMRPIDTVRMSIAKGQFEKGYIPNYGDEILEIDAVKRHTKPMRYKLRDAKGEKFKGFFYPEELTPVRKEADTTYRIERVFRKRKRADGTMEVLVKFIVPKASNTTIEHLREFLTATLKNHAESLESKIKDGSKTPIRRKRAASQPQSPPNAIVPKSPPSAASNTTSNVKVPTSPPRVGQNPQENVEEINESSLTNVTKPPEKQPKIEKQPEVIKGKSGEINHNISQHTYLKNDSNQKDSQNQVLRSTSSFPKPTSPLPVSNVDGRSVSQKNIPPPPISNPSTNVTKKQEGLKSSSGTTHSVSKPPPPPAVTNQTTVSQTQQIVVAPPAQRNETKPQSAISEVNQKEIGPSPEQRNGKSIVESISIPKQPQPVAPTHSNVTEKKATSPPPALAIDSIGPPPEQRNGKSIVESISMPKQPQPVAPTHANVTEKKAISPPPALAIDSIGPPPKQRSEKSTVETVSQPKHPPAAPPTPSNATEKKAASPPRAILTDYIGPPPKQRNEKSLNSKQGQTQLVTEITPDNTKKTTTITTTTTTTITEPPKDTIGELVGRIEKPSERNNAEQLLSVLFGDEEWKKINLRILRQIIEGIELQYHQNFERFKALGYVLGFENHQNVRNNEIAKYGSDLRGGFASFAVYAKGLTENMIVGNSLSSLLRVVSVSGAVPGEYTEKIYDSPLYARVLPKEVLEIEIELRTMTDGRLVHNRFSVGGALHKLVQESETFLEDFGAFFCL